MAGFRDLTDVETLLRAVVSDNELVATRRRHIAESAGRLLVKRGYCETTMRNIADACGMGIGSLYNYIGSKEDVLYLVLAYATALYMERVKKIEEVIDALSATEALRQGIETLYRAVDETQDFLLFSYTEMKHLPSDLRRHILGVVGKLQDEVFIRILNKGRASGEFVIEEVAAVANCIVVTGEMWAVRRWSLRSEFTIDEYIRQYADFFTEAVTAREPKVASRV